MELRLKKLYKHITHVLIVLLLIASMATPALATIKWLSGVVPVSQAKSNWCWAAGSEMVIKYFGGSADQWAVVNYIYPNQGYPNYAATMSQTDSAIDHFQYRNGVVTSSSLSFTAVKYQTNNNCPIVAGWGWYSGGGHMTVIRGYDDAYPSYVYWCDPADGAGHKNTYSWFIDNGVHYWRESIYYQ
jgi:hypothetical protein